MSRRTEPKDPTMLDQARPRPRPRAFAALAATLAAVAVAAPAAADKLLTTDGRVIDVKKARKSGDDYELTFEHGTIVCPPQYVASVEIEGDMSDYVPKNDDEKQKLEQGFVRYQGRWWSKPAYENELRKKTDAARERTAELAAHADWHNCYVEETRHFVIRTNTSPELLEYYVNLMETWYKTLDRRVGINPPPQLRRTKMTVNIWKNRKEFSEMNAAGVGGGVAGYFSFLEESLNFYHDFEDPTISDWIALHEGTHLLTYLIEPQAWPQIWINEGIADYLGSATIVVDEDDPSDVEEIIPGKIQTDRILTVQNAIKDGSYVKLERLFSVTKAEFSAFEYAHAWAFVYFLNNSKKEYQRGFDKFFKDIYTLPKKKVDYTMEPFQNKEGVAKIVSPEEVRRVLLDHLGVHDVEALEKEWKEFIGGIELDTPEALFKRGYRFVSYFEGDREEALDDLTRAIDGGVTDPRAYWARGRLKSLAGDAEDDFRKACEMSPLEARFRFDLGREIAGIGGLFFAGMGNVQIKVEGRTEEFDIDVPLADLEKAYVQIGLATELDPDNDYFRDYYQDLKDELEERRAEAAGGGGQ